MQRPPIACRRAVHSLTPTPPQYIWVSDELLALTVQRFFRAGCAHQKRHGSNVPGPLEARRRAVRRRMTVQAHAPSESFLPPLFNLAALLGGRASPQPSWRYEPPSVPPAPQSSAAIEQCPPIALEYFESGGIMAQESATQLDMETAEESVAVSQDQEAFLVRFKSWANFAGQLPESERFIALSRFCEEEYPVGDQAGHATLLILQHLAGDNWAPSGIFRWLSEPAIPLPLPGTPDRAAFFQQLSKLIARHDQERYGKPHLGGAIDQLYTKILTPVLSQVRALNKGVYRARWRALFDSHSKPMERQDLRSLRGLRRILMRLNGLLTEDTPKHAELIKGTTDQAIRLLYRLAASDSVQHALLDQLSHLLPQSLLSAWASAMSFRPRMQISSRVAAALHDEADLCNHQFWHILGRAREAHVLPIPYWDLSKDTPMEDRAEIIHQLAHQYSTEHTRSHLQNMRSLSCLCRYLRQYQLPMSPVFTRSLVRTFLSRPMTENRFVSSRRMAWVCGLVASVEGEKTARKIESQFWQQRGMLIDHSKRRWRGLGGDGKTHINTLNKIRVN